MWTRVARFEGDPADIDARLERLRPLLDAGAIPPELADARFLLLVDRASGRNARRDLVRQRRGDAQG